MMSLQQTKMRETFILRMWQDNGKGSKWRGQVQCVSTGEMVAFQDISALFEYIKAQLDEQNDRQNKQGLR